jgi:hypothetical protein
MPKKHRVFWTDGKRNHGSKIVVGKRRKTLVAAKKREGCVVQCHRLSSKEAQQLASERALSAVRSKSRARRR